MAESFSDEVQTLVKERLATGKYASENDVLVRALRTLREYDEAVADIQEGLDDEAAGRLYPLHEAAAEIRRTLGFAK